MRIDGPGSAAGVIPDVAGEPARSPSSSRAEHSIGQYQEQPLDPFRAFGEAIGSAFSFLAGQQHDPKQAAAMFDLGSILNQVFSFVGNLFGGATPEAPSQPTVAPKREGTSCETQDDAEAKRDAARTEQKRSVNVPVLSDRVSTGSRNTTRVTGQLDAGALKLKGEAQASSYAQASAQGQVTVGTDGVGVSGGAEAAIGASASARGEIETPIGGLKGHAEVTAELFARIKGYANVGVKGADAAAKAETGALARAAADADANLLGGLVKGHADAIAESGTGATAQGKVGLTYDPPKVVLDGAAGAFAGARAGFSAKGGVAGVSYGVEAEAWAGVGAKAEFHAGLDDGKFRFSGGLGAALGVGAFIRIDFEIDFKDVGSTIKGVVGAAGSIVGGVVGGIAKGVGDVLGGIFGAVAGLFGGGKGDGSHASNLLGQCVQQHVPSFAGVPGLGGTAPVQQSTVWSSDGDDDPHRAKSFDDRFSSLK